MELIPTAHKGRLPKGQSHPLGAEIVSDALRGVPLWSELDLRFNAIQKHGLGLFVPGGGGSLRGRTGRQLLSFLEVMYCGFWGSGVWTIGTFPVRSSDRDPIRKILTTLALPRLREWLSEDRPETWFSPQRYLQFGLAKDFRQIGVLETHNDRVVQVEILPAGGPTP